MPTTLRVDLDLLDDNPWQPRVAMDQEALQTLADNIRELGLLQAPVGRPADGGRIQLAFGHRRVAACRILRDRGQGPALIDVDIADISDERMAVMALSENTHRQQLTQIEVVRAHKRAIEETNLTVQGLAKQLDMSRPNLANNLRVLELPDVVLEHVESGALSLSVAREFLVLQHAGHVHLEDMQQVVRVISSVYGRRGAPDWSRRHVRERIYERVAYNEMDWRPLGPKPAHTVGGADKEASFEVESFKEDNSDSLHTIPAVSEYKVVNYEAQLICDGSRLWTCEVKEWSRRQSRATREANRAGESTGQGAPAKTKNDRASQLGELLAKDPVWREIAGAREKKGPHRPVTDEERQQLGTRAEFREVNPYGRNPFWKLLEIDKNAHPNRWNDANGGSLPPFFPDLEGCMSCTAGAAYVRSDNHHRTGNQPRLACFNERCYNDKLSAGTAEFRKKLEGRKRGLFREDRENAQRLVRELESLGAGSLRALATTLMLQTARLELQHPFRHYTADWSYEARATSRAREILGLEFRTGDHGVQFINEEGLKALASVDQGDLRELVANLMVHHLRIGGRLDTVSQGTPGDIHILHGTERNG